MTEPDAPEVPSEDDTLLGEDGFDFDAWKLRAAAGKYDGHLLDMAAFLAKRAIAGNSRRWKIRWRGDEVTEDDYTLTAVRHAEQFAGMQWGVMNLSIGVDIQLSGTVAQALLYGMARTRFHMDDKAARKAVDEVRAIDLLDILEYYEAPGKAEGSPEPTTT